MIPCVYDESLTTEGIFMDRSKPNPINECIEQYQMDFDHGFYVDMNLFYD